MQDIIQHFQQKVSLLSTPAHRKPVGVVAQSQSVGFRDRLLKRASGVLAVGTASSGDDLIDREAKATANLRLADPQHVQEWSPDRARSAIWHLIRRLWRSPEVAPANARHNETADAVAILLGGITVNTR
ncbi:hypothetical protein ACWIG5_32800 [Streptomyces lydicus]